jgi:probable HAF family extracellular repeat protein
LLSLSQSSLHAAPHTDLRITVQIKEQIMSISLKKVSARMLSLAAGCTFAGILAACGGDGNGGHSHPHPPVPEPGLTYDVIPLSLGGTGVNGFVGRKGITADGKVGGTIDVADGSIHAFLYDGARMVDLGTMGGVLSETAAINQLGHVVGWVRFQNDVFHAFLYDGTMHDLGTLGGQNSFAIDINDRGQVTGEAQAADGIRHAFLYENGMMRQLKTPGGAGSISYGQVINASGTVAGIYGDPNGFTRTFLATACDCPKDIGTLGGNQTYVFAINDAGKLAGISEDAAGHRRAFLYENGAIRDIGTFGGDSAVASTMNQAGQVVGYALTESRQTHAFMYDGQLLRDLGTLPGGTFSEATAINASGQVTGVAYTAKGESHAMTWTAAGGLVDLNTVLHKPPAGLVLVQGFAISDNGSIVAQANPGLVLLKVHQRP